MKKSILPAIPVLILIFLLMHPAQSFEGAKSGLLLWFNVVLPTLLPFMLCSSLLVAWGGVPLITRPFSPLFKLLHLSDGGSYALMAGLLCGYPMGAKTTADFLREGKITANEGKRLLAIAGCPSPMFVAGYVHSHLDGTVPFISVAVSLYIPVILLGFLVQVFYRDKTKGRNIASTDYSVKSRSTAPLPADIPPAKSQPFDEIMMSSLEIMVKIGGYIMLYSILACFICGSGLIPEPVKPLLTGFVEMTTGIDNVSRSLSGLPAALVILFSAAFGGLSGVSQTNTVIKNAGLSIRHYILWKLVHASLACFILILLSSL
nr:nucleoside recognition protein [Clostridium transplantifaecale]